jgi:hypothetical protein
MLQGTPCVPVAVQRRTWRTLMLTSAQMSMLIDGVDWRAPERRDNRCDRLT